MTKDESREAVYGMPYETWKAKYQGSATPEQLEAMKKVHPPGIDAAALESRQLPLLASS